MSKPPITHTLMVVDMSGSMANLAEDVRGGFNTYLDQLAQRTEHRYRVTTTVFDTEFVSLCVAAKLKDAPRLDRQNYMPRGGTALLDAVGKTITEFEACTTLGEEERVVLVVQTDGHENSSSEFTSSVVSRMIDLREATGKWFCVYLGAGPAAWGQGQTMGFRSNYSSAATPGGMQSRYKGAQSMTVAVAQGATHAEADIAVAAVDGVDREPGSDGL